jgi:hypothetical protein
VDEKKIRFHYPFSHGGLWLKSIPDLTILFSHGGLWLKSMPDFGIHFSHRTPYFTDLLATAFCG